MSQKIHKLFIRSFDDLEIIAEDFKDSLWLYMCYGLEPGSFGMAVLTNDFMGAALGAHPAVPASMFKGLAQWLKFMAPYQSYGSEQQVKKWQSFTDDQRRDIMIECHLRPSVFEVLSGEYAA